MSIKTIIFDWAGTTVDYGCMAPVNAFKKAFADQGINLTNLEIREPMGQLKRHHTESLLKTPTVRLQWRDRYGTTPEKNDLETIYRAFEKYLFQDLAENSLLKPDTLSALTALKAAGFQIGSTTGYTSEMMSVVTETAKNQGYQPDFIVTPDDVDQFGRPYPYMIYQNMVYFKNRNVTEVAKVGDTRSDIEEGKNAGVFTVAVIEGSSEMGLSLAEFQALSASQKKRLAINLEEKFYHWGADLCVANLTELVDYLLSQRQQEQLA